MAQRNSAGHCHTMFLTPYCAKGFMPYTPRNKSLILEDILGRSKLLEWAPWGRGEGALSCQHDWTTTPKLSHSHFHHLTDHLHLYITATLFRDSQFSHSLQSNAQCADTWLTKPFHFVITILVIDLVCHLVSAILNCALILIVWKLTEYFPDFDLEFDSHFGFGLLNKHTNLYLYPPSELISDSLIIKSCPYHLSVSSPEFHQPGLKHTDPGEASGIAPCYSEYAEVKTGSHQCPPHWPCACAIILLSDTTWLCSCNYHLSFMENIAMEEYSTEANRGAFLHLSHQHWLHSSLYKRCVEIFSSEKLQQPKLSNSQIPTPITPHSISSHKILSPYFRSRYDFLQREVQAESKNTLSIS